LVLLLLVPLNAGGLFFCHRAILDFNVASNDAYQNNVASNEAYRNNNSDDNNNKNTRQKNYKFQGINFGVPQGFDLGLFFYLLVFKRISQK
jgi:hypothetical protein